MPDRPRVYVTRRLPQEALSVLSGKTDIALWEGELPPAGEEIVRSVSGCQGLLSLLTDVIDEKVMDAAPGLRIISNMAVGYNNIDVPAATKRGIMVTNTPGVLTETTADLTFALLLATARRLTEASEFLRQGRWKTWSPMALTGLDVYGATLGIIGFGRIGQAVARRASGFNMRVLYTDRRERPEAAEIGAQFVSVDGLLRASDFVSLHVPLTEETWGLIGQQQLGLMKTEAILINTARGEVVDQEALIDALRHRRIGGAGLDVMVPEPLPPDHPLCDLDNAVLLPHIGSASVATRTKMAVIAARNLLAGVGGESPPNLVNPEVLEGKPDPVN